MSVYFDEDDGEAVRKEPRAFDFRCAMGRVPVTTPLTVRQVRKARALQTGLNVYVPHVRIESGPNRGICIGGDGLDIALRLPCDHWSMGDLRGDKFPGVGRVFPVRHENMQESEESSDLQFLVFDSEDSEWYLSCGGGNDYWLAAARTRTYMGCNNTFG